MKQFNIRYFIDWCVILIFIAVSYIDAVSDYLWSGFRYIAPVLTSLALGVLLLNHISIKDCIKRKDKEFMFLIAGGLVAGINILLIKSNVGSLLTICNFLLILFLADKVQFDKVQLGAVAFSSFFVLFYWIFINRGTYGNVINPNGAALFIFAHFCVFICSITYFLSTCFQASKRQLSLVILAAFCIVAGRLIFLQCRGVLLAMVGWAVTCYILPKKKITIPLVLAASLIMPAVYVLVWKGGTLNGVIIYGKRFDSGREGIWYEFFKAFVRHPITGIGSDFDRMIPDGILKNVHHALLDLLFVHGIPVFVIVLYFLYKRTEEIVSSAEPMSRVHLACLYGAFVAGSFENYYIFLPYNVLFMMIFIIFHMLDKDKVKSGKL